MSDIHENNNKIKMHIRFLISSDKDDFDTDIITQVLDLKPTKCYKKGELIFPDATVKYKHTGWVLGIKTIESIDASDEISKLLNILMPKEREVRELCFRYSLDIELGCIIYIHEQTPVLNFSRKMIEQIDRLNASLDIDIMLV